MNIFLFNPKIPELKFLDYPMCRLRALVQYTVIGLKTSIGLLTVCSESFHSSDADSTNVSSGIGGPFSTTLNDSFWCNRLNFNIFGLTFTERPLGVVTLAL